MKAMIFAAGEGTRLRPLTLSTPKPLVEVGGEPMLARVLRAVIAAGATQVVVNVHHLSHMVTEWLERQHFNVPVNVSDESCRLLDTGGGLLKAAPMLEGSEPILLHNADICTDLDLTRLHLRGDASLLVSGRRSSRCLLFDSSKRLCGWRNLTTGKTLGNAAGTPLAFNGIHLVSPTIFPVLRRYAERVGEVFSLTPFYVDNADELEIYGQELDEYRWFDIGDMPKLEAARASFAI